jgi:hypothetical protein
MHKSATKCNETVGKWCKNKHGASKIIDTLETYHITHDFEKAINLKLLLYMFELMSGLKINYQKSEIFLLVGIILLLTTTPLCLAVARWDPFL